MDAMRLLGGLLGNNVLGGSQGGRILRTLSRGLGGRRSTTTSILGGLAVTAVQHFMRQHMAGGGARPMASEIPGGDGLGVPAGAESGERARLLVEAMVAAAKADGTVDREEQQRILGQLGELDAEAMQFLRETMENTPDPTDLARRTPRDMRGAVYGASLAAIRVDTPAETAYLRELAEQLGLDRQAVAEIHAELGVT